MGAHDFFTTGIGRTIGEAYAEATRTATYEYGHDPYNGTVSTTSGVVNVSDALAPFSAKRRDEIAQASIGVYPFDPTFDSKPKRGDYDRLVNYRGSSWLVPKNLRKDEWAVAIDLSEKVEKWGPALGYEVTGVLATEAKKRYGGTTRGRKVFRFFGLAAS